jgi:hypothetical protein
MSNLARVLNQLQQEYGRLTSELERINNAIAALIGVSKNGTSKGISGAVWARKRQKVVANATSKTRTMSNAAIARIREAQKARWARWKAKQKKSA